ncbi:MAG: cupredoxin domain-containing protein [bacterium]|nr:cupredoxin domain-containing protein [bacterium]
MEENTNQVIPQQQPVSQPKSKGRAKKATLLIGATLLVLGAASVYVIRNNKNDSESLVTSSEATDIAEVGISEEGFSPATITVKKGQSVKWTNQGSAVHQVASDPHPVHDALPGLFAPTPLESEDTYTYTFEETGTFTYHDHLSPFKLKGNVIVE